MKKLLILALLSTPLMAQSPSGLLGPNRYIDWSHAGATIPNRTVQCGSTITPGASAATIQAALTACAGTNQYVLLGAGTFNLSASIVTTASGVTLRGSGPQSTFLHWTATSSNCLGIGTSVAFCAYNGSSTAYQYSPNVCTITAGTTQGSTSVTLGTSVSSSIAPFTSCTLGNLHVGSLMQITQVDDSTTDNGEWWENGNGPNPPNAYTTWGGASNGWVPNYATNGNPGRSLGQNVTVTNIAGSVVTFSPALYAPKWSQSATPYANYASALPISGFGLENLTLDTTALGDHEAQMEFVWATNSWVKNVAGVGPNVNAGSGSSRKHVLTASSNHVTIRDSYFFGSGGASDGYGVDFAWGTSDSLAENNIFQHISTGTITENGSGNVFGYNYAVDNYFQQGAGYWQQCDAFHHDAGDHYNLWEGHEGICAYTDDFHGPSFGITFFRSRFSGFDPANTCPSGASGCGTVAKLQDVTAFFDMAYNRYENFFANVVGTSGTTTTYTNTGASALSGGSLTNCPAVNWFVAYSLNYSDQNQLAFSTAPGTCFSAAFNLDNDPKSSASLARWGNYDTVNASVQTNSGETGSSAPVYPGLASPSTSWASYKSLYYAAKPSWWPGTIPWPAVGPDVTGGNIPNVGGHAYHNPAATCYLSVLGGSVTGSSGPLPFDAANCPYSSGGTTFTLSVSTAGSGSGTITGSNCFTQASIASGTSINCIATASGGSTFAGWSGGTCSGTSTPCPFSITANSTVIATFNTSGATAGTPTLTPVAGSYAVNTAIAINDTTAGGVCSSHIWWCRNSIGVSCTPSLGDINGTSITLLATSRYCAAVLSCPSFSDSASFCGDYTALPSFTLTVTATRGTVTGTNCTPGSYTSGTLIGICTANPSSGYTFTGWIGPPCAASGTSPCSFNISGNSALQPQFTASTVTILPGSGTYGTAQSVTLSTATTGATICYTTNGTDPASSPAGSCAIGSFQYTGIVTVSSSLTLKAIATISGAADSPVASATYSIGRVATPTFSPVAGTYASAQRVAISTSTPAATCKYTVDGSDPAVNPSAVIYTHPIYINFAIVGLAASCTASGLATSADGFSTYLISPVKTRFSLSTTSASVNPVPFPQDNRMCCGTNVAALEATRGTYTLTPFENFITQSIAHSATTTYTIQGFPTWMTGLGATESAPPTDLNVSAACQNVLTGVTTTDCSMKEFVTKLMMDRTGLSSQPSSPVTCANLDYLEIINEFNTDSPSGSSTGWTGTYADLATLGNDISSVTHAWCSNTVVIAGSASAVVGFHSNGEDAHYDAALLTLLTDWAGLSSPSLPDAISVHVYPSRDTITPMPMPTTIVSNSDSNCTSGNTPNVNCYIAVKDEINQLKTTATLKNTGIISWAGFLPVFSTEGGFGEVSQLGGSSTTIIGASYVAQSMVAIAAQQPVNHLFYAANDATWGCYWDCGSGTSAWLFAFNQMNTWLNTHTITAALSSSSITGGTQWIVPLDGDASEIRFCDAWLTSCTTTTTFSTQQTLDGTVSATGGSITLTQEPLLLFNTAPTPTFSPVAGAYSSTQNVTIAPTVGGYTLCYTIDGSDPTASGGSCTHGTTYTTPVVVASSLTLKAVSSASTFTTSPVASATYTITTISTIPTFAPGAGTYAGTQNVTISTVTSGATLCYTTDGSTPTANGAGTCTHGTTYSTPVAVASSLTLKAVASKSGLIDSAVGSAAYTILPPPTVTITIAGLTKFSGVITVK